VAWVAIGAMPHGALGILMTSYLVRRAWTEELHLILVAATSVLPVVAMLFLPVLIGMKELYPAASDTHSLPGFQDRLSRAVVLRAPYGNLFCGAACPLAASRMR
jgi:hypothetical protein